MDDNPLEHVNDLTLASGRSMSPSGEGRRLLYPSAALAWALAFLSLIFTYTALVSVPLAIRAARKGNRLAWWCVPTAVFCMLASFRLWG